MVPRLSLGAIRKVIRSGVYYTLYTVASRANIGANYYPDGTYARSYDDRTMIMTKWYALQDVTEGCGSQGQADTTAAVSAGTADSLPLLLDTDKLNADLPQPLDEQISPNMVIKSMSGMDTICYF